MPEVNRKEKIKEALEAIKHSPLSAREYIQQNDVPFSLAQYYRYRTRIASEGEEGLKDRRDNEHSRKLKQEEIGFIRGLINQNRHISLSHIQRALRTEFGITVHRSSIGRALKKLGITVEPRDKEETKKREQVSCAGFELIAALALHLGWVEHTSKCIMKVIEERCRQQRPSGSPEKRGRDAQGQFTKEYNQLEEIRRMRFASIDQKRAKKNFKKMNICKISEKNLQRKSLAILSLPLVTLNGQMRNVNIAIGNALRGFCGYNYKQATLDCFLRELKYLGVSQDLLCGQIQFWQKQWPRKDELQVPFLCYYIDGNTKAVWSKQHVPKHKVSMLGRVMGCLEQVFINDCFGRPIYFETYSGHGPVGVYTLELMDKIERYLEESSNNGHVTRVLVMDGANNSAATLRAFAAQKRYHYITMLDSNQWSERKVRSERTYERYRWGNATLYDGAIELTDSKDKGYIVLARTVRIEWDNGKRTVLLTSLPVTIGASLVVKAYFDRWPQQELVFRAMKGFASLHLVAGYGKQKMEDSNVRMRQQWLEQKISNLRNLLRSPLDQIAQYTAALSALILQERALRSLSRIENGKRIQSLENTQALQGCTKETRRLQRRIKATEKPYLKKFDQLRRYEAWWLRLQGKQVVYKVDVELDQILTYFRVSLANIAAYFLKHFLDMGPTCFSTLMQEILLLDGEIEETHEMRKVTLNRNLKDPVTMERLEAALTKFNALPLHTLSGKAYQFKLS